MHGGAVALVAGLVACSSTMVEALRVAVSYARAHEPVVIVGPTGAGKSCLARLIHRLSERSGTLAEVSCGEFVSTLVDDQLFGHVRGGFTDASSHRQGVFAEAGAGSVLLDDFHLLDRTGQSRLLRVLDTGQYRMIGSERQMPLLARLLIGTGRDLDTLAAEGTLLPDLRYRLGFFTVRLPGLTERREDIAPLAEAFLRASADDERGRPVLSLGPDAVAALETAPWPGNVRELERAICFAAWQARVAGEVLVRAEHLPVHLRRGTRFEPHADAATKERLIAWALWRTEDHVGRAAELIGAHRNTVSAIRLELRERADVRLHNEGSALVQSAVSDAQSA